MAETRLTVGSDPSYSGVINNFGWLYAVRVKRYLPLRKSVRTFRLVKRLGGRMECDSLVAGDDTCTLVRGSLIICRKSQTTASTWEVERTLTYVRPRGSLVGVRQRPVLQWGHQQLGSLYVWQRPVLQWGRTRLTVGSSTTG